MKVKVDAAEEAAAVKVDAAEKTRLVLYWSAAVVSVASVAVIGPTVAHPQV